MYFGFRAQNEQKNHNQPTLVAHFHRVGRVSTVQYGTEPNTLIQLVFPLPTLPLLDRRDVCRKVAIDNKALQ